MKHINPCVFLLVFAVGVCLTCSAVAEPSAEAEATTAKSIASLPFEKRVCRIGMECLRPTRYDSVQKKHLPIKPMYGLAPEEVADIVAEMGAELWTVGSHFRGVWFASEMVKRDPYVNHDDVQRMVNRAHQHGIFAYASPHLSEVDNLDLKGQMDKWKVHSIDDGRDIGLNPRFQSFASTGFTNWMGRHMIEHIEMVGYDGFWFDGTPFGPRHVWPWPAGGVGPEAAERYKRDTGYDLPEKEDWDDPNFKRWVKWRYDVTIDCWDKITAIAATADPDVVPIMNYMPRPDFLWHSGHPMRKIHDSQWVPSLEVEGSMMDKVGRALTPRTEIYFWAHGSYVPEIAHGFLPNFDPDRQIAKALRAMAHGLVPCVSGFEVDIHLWKDSFKKIFDQLKPRRDYFQGDTVKYAAMVISQQTRDYRKDNDPLKGGVGNNADATTFHGIPVLHSMWHGAEGVNGMHNVSHLLLDVIFDDSLNVEDMSKYKIVILDDVACLSKAQCDAIRQYVHSGGTIIAMRETSLYDEWGNRRDNFELADLFGVDYKSTESGVTRVLVPHDDDLKKQFGHFITFFARGTRVALRDGADAELLMARSPVASASPLNVTVDPFDSDEPDIVRRRVGQGTVIYSATDLGDGYQLHERRRVADLLAALEREAAQPLIEFDAPPHSVETRALWKDDDTIIVHIVNMTALYAKHMAPVADIGITLDGRQIKSATSPITDRHFEITDNSINVPSVGHGEVVVLEVD